MEVVTSDELRVTSEEGLSPAMREWGRKLAAGYSIRPRLRMGRKGQAYLEWGPALFNADGAFVRNIRRDTMRKLMRLGLLEEGGRVDGVGAAAGMDECDGEDGDAAGGRAGVGGG